MRPNRDPVGHAFHLSRVQTSAESFAVEFQGTKFSITVYRQLGGTSWAFSSTERLCTGTEYLWNSASYSPGEYFTNKLRAVSSGTTIFVTICQWSGRNNDWSLSVDLCDVREMDVHGLVH